MARQGTLVILNPSAGATLADDARELIESSAEIWTTKAPGDGIVLARRAVRDDFATVIAAGGDGTLNEVVNGLMPHPGGVVCGVLPLGTGNDFARTLRIPREPLEAWRVLNERRVRPFDVGSLAGDRADRWFINMAVGGAIDEVHEKLTVEIKQRWGPFAYLRAGAEAIANLLAEIGPHHVEIELDGGATIERDVWSVAVANGRTVGGGIPIAPHADPADGLLDCVAVEAVRGLELAKVSASVLLGHHLDSPLDEDGPIVFRRARRIEIRSSPEMPFTTDGEVSEGKLTVFTAHPRSLEMIEGPPDGGGF